MLEARLQPYRAPGAAGPRPPRTELTSNTALLVPVDNLHALNELAGHFRGSDLSDTVVMFSRPGQRQGSERLRPRPGRADRSGACRGGGQAADARDKVADQDVASIRVACIHGLFTDGGLQRIAARDEVTEILCTNSVPIAGATDEPTLTVLSIAPAIAPAIRRIHDGESVSALFH